MKIQDDTQRYGFISRLFHWGMAFLFAWQFAGMLAKICLGRRHELTQLLSANHVQIGCILFVMLLARAIWAIVNRTNRPGFESGLMGLAARLGHLALYLLVLFVPSAALIRAWGSNMDFAPFGFTIFAHSDSAEALPAAMRFGSLLHGTIAWLLAAMILGHITMALYHHFIEKNGLLNRMAR